MLRYNNITRFMVDYYVDRHSIYKFNSINIKYINQYYEFYM